MATAALPLFHLYGDPPDDQAFDFIHIETIASRSSIHDWTIRAHRHRNLFQILLIERGGGEMTFEAATIAFDAPCAILVPATIAHGFRFRPALTDGWVMTFTEDVAAAKRSHASKGSRPSRSCRSGRSSAAVCRSWPWNCTKSASSPAPAFVSPCADCLR